MRLSTDQLMLVAEMLREKRSAREIAKIIGCSRSAIIGHVWRHPDLRAIGFASPPNGGPGIRTRLRRELKAKLGQADYHGNGQRLLAKGKPLEKLASGQCRFPLWGHGDRPSTGQMMFCSEMRTADSSYCDVHRNICRGAARQLSGRKRL
jgi:hypothetical protein